MMKYTHLIWAGLWRKKTRTLLTMVSVAVAFLLFGLLHGINRGMNNVIDHLNGKRLVTASRYAPLEGITLAVRDRIAAVPGVTGVAPWVYFGGFYRDRRNAVGVFATDAPALFRLYDEFKIAPEQLAAMRHTRTGALITKELARQYHWRIGDAVPIGTSLWPTKEGRNAYTFDVVGIYDRGGTPVNGFLINYDYLDEERQIGTGTVHYYVVGIDDPRHADAISKTIDAQFANSPHETRTQTEQAYLASTLKQIADVNLIVKTIVGAVLFTLLLLTGTTMMQSVRDRIAELAVLKAIGFTDAAVAACVVAESLVLCLVSAIVGLAAARLTFAKFAAVIGVVSMPLSVIGTGIALAAALAIASGLIPAARASRIVVAEALARR
jgi:putative ABC transport system permease protein